MICNSFGIDDIHGSAVIVLSYIFVLRAQKKALASAGAFLMKRAERCAVLHLYGDLCLYHAKNENLLDFSGLKW